MSTYVNQSLWLLIQNCFIEVSRMKEFRFALSAILMVLAVPAVMHAQSGCSDSPEAPTDVLLMIRSVGMIYGSSLAMKLLRAQQVVDRRALRTEGQSRFVGPQKR